MSVLVTNTYTMVCDRCGRTMGGNSVEFLAGEECVIEMAGAAGWKKEINERGEVMYNRHLCPDCGSGGGEEVEREEVKMEYIKFIIR